MAQVVTRKIFKIFKNNFLKKRCSTRTRTRFFINLNRFFDKVL